MAPPRIEIVGACYHVTANAVDGMKLFADDDDHARYFELFADQAARSGWRIFEYSFMTTHVHVVLQLRESTLSSGFQRLNSLYARELNRRRRRRGVVWQKRFFDVLIETDAHLLESIRYVALNAPRANMCALPEEWAWCSYGSAIGVRPADPLVDEAALLGLFGTTPERARRALRAFVEEKDPRVRRGLTPVRPLSDL